MTWNHNKNTWFVPLLATAALGSGATVLYYRFISKKIWKDKDESKTFNENVTSGTHATSCSPSDALDLTQNRRSIFPKQYTGKPVPRNVIDDMLEAARWAPTHGLTESWQFIIFESEASRVELGHFLAKLYKEETNNNNKPFNQSKFDKKLKNCVASSHVIAICVRVATKASERKNPLVEEICSVAMAVQNMHLLASAHGVGAYWSSGGIYEAGTKSNDEITNPAALRQFLTSKNDELESSTTCTSEKETCNYTLICLGWFFIGEYFASTNDIDNQQSKKWPKGRRTRVDGKISWK